MINDSPIFRRGGPAALFGFMVKGPGTTAVTMTVRHRDLGEKGWVVARSVTLLGPGESSFEVSDLKEELRTTIAAGPESQPANVLVLPPKWLPR